MSIAYYLRYSNTEEFSDNSFAVFCQLASELLVKWSKKYRNVVPRLLDLNDSHPSHKQWTEHNLKVLKILEDKRSDAWKVAALKGLWYQSNRFELYTAISGPISVPHKVDADWPVSVCITYNNSPVDELCAAIYKVAARFSSALTYSRLGEAPEAVVGETLADSIWIGKIHSPIFDPFGELSAYQKAEWLKANGSVC